MAKRKIETKPVEEILPVQEPTAVSAEKENIESKAEPTIGTVTECMKLNVRKSPKSDAVIVKVINFASKVEIIPRKTQDDFYKVRLADGTTGYCMKKFINV